MSQTNESSKSPDESTRETENIVSSEAASTTESSSTDSRAEYLKEVVDMRLELKEQRLEMVTQLRERVNLINQKVELLKLLEKKQKLEDELANIISEE